MKIECVCTISGDLYVLGSISHLLECGGSFKGQFVLISADKYHYLEMLGIQDGEHTWLNIFVVDQNIVGAQDVSFGIL